jgi:hypothetical protein
MHTRQNSAVAWSVILLAFALRAGVLWVHRADLAEDPDAYRSVAEGLLEGKGFANQVTGKPTAFRPPLYPLVIAGGLSLNRGMLPIAVFHLLAGTGTVWLTLRIGRKLGLGSGAVVAALLVAVDPLLLQYTSYVMTETVFTFLLTALLAAVVEMQIEIDGPRGGARRQIETGILFGLCALCRPTIWPVGVLAVIWWIVSQLTSQTTTSRWRTLPWLLLVSVAVVVSPWLIRNLIVFGKPIYTTTHGGYTLLLANNPVYYQQEVEQPFGTVWEDAPAGATQRDWLVEMRARMASDLGKDASEPEQDRWMYSESYRTIRDQPQAFLRACLLRFTRFWNVAPLGRARAGFSAILVWGVTVFYVVELIGFVFGLTRVPRGDWSRWTPLLITIIGFTLVHLVFWTNTRMRAPVIPAISLFFAVGWGDLQRALRGAQTGEKRPSETSHNS